MVPHSCAAIGPVLALEFTGVGPQLDYPALFAALGAPGALLIDPLEPHGANELSLDAQAVQVVTRCTVLPAVVIGHCSSAALALRIAAVCGGAACAHAVLLDPDTVTDDQIRSEFAGIAANLGLVPTTPLRRTEDLHGRELASRLAVALQDARAPLLADHQDDPDAAELVDDLLGRHRAWLRFLGATAQSGPIDAELTVSLLSDGGTTDPAPFVAGGRALVSHAGVPINPTARSMAEVAARVRTDIETMRRGGYAR